MIRLATRLKPDHLLSLIPGVVEVHRGVVFLRCRIHYPRIVPLLLWVTSLFQLILNPFCPSNQLLSIQKATEKTKKRRREKATVARQDQKERRKTKDTERTVVSLGTHQEAELFGISSVCSIRLVCRFRTDAAFAKAGSRKRCKALWYRKYVN